MTRESGKSAITGFAICSAVVAMMFVWLYLSSPSVATEIAPNDFGFRTDIIEGGRTNATKTSLFLLAILFVYWLIAASLGRGNVSTGSTANCILTFAFALFLVVVANEFYGWIDTYCDQLPFPHNGFMITKIYECDSSNLFFSALLWASLLLTLTSLVIRIVLSRRPRQEKAQ